MPTVDAIAQRAGLGLAVSREVPSYGAGNLTADPSVLRVEGGRQEGGARRHLVLVLHAANLSMRFVAPPPRRLP